jgi:hypothetical protein
MVRIYRAEFARSPGHNPTSQDATNLRLGLQSVKIPEAQTGDRSEAAFSAAGVGRAGHTGGADKLPQICQHHERPAEKAKTTSVRDP